MLLAGTTLHAQPVEPAATSQVRILATGGTIAGKGNASGTSYRSGAVSVDDLIAALPGVDKIARVTGEQIANVPSSDMDETIWRKLHARALAAFADPDVAGVVVTHGTDTLEETAFLLSDPGGDLARFHRARRDGGAERHDLRSAVRHQI